MLFKVDGLGMYRRGMTSRRLSLISRGGEASDKRNLRGVASRAAVRQHRLSFDTCLAQCGLLQCCMMAVSLAPTCVGCRLLRQLFVKLGTAIRLQAKEQDY